MKESFLKGPTRLTRRSSLGNGLWWIAKRQMSSWRLNRNHEAIQTRIAKFEKRASLRTFTVTLGFSLLFGTIAWGTSWQIDNLLLSAPALTYEPTIASPSPNLQNLKQIRLIAAPPLPDSGRQTQAKPPLRNRQSLTSTPARTSEILKKPAYEHLGQAKAQKPAYPLSKLLKRFREAKRAHENGDLDQATRQFLKIAREQSHPSLGPESYLRAIAILRVQGHHPRAIQVLEEAKLVWPTLTETRGSGLQR